MPGYKQLAQEITEQIQSAIKPLQDLSIDVVSSVAGAVGEYVPALNVAPVTPEEIADTNFGLAETFLDNSKAYTARVLKALEPITGKLVETSKPKSAKVTAA
jgi:hypothetical protein